LIKRADEFKKEKFDVFLGGVLAAIQPAIDTNKYEDFARVVLGSKAYLLFSFDKLILSVIKCVLMTFIDWKATIKLSK
jgi:hypothetical protein